MSPPPEAARFDVTAVKVTYDSLVRVLGVGFLIALCAIGPIGDAFPRENLDVLAGAIAGALAIAALALTVGNRAKPGRILVEGDHLIVQRSRRRERIPLDHIALGLIFPRRKGDAKEGDPFRYQVSMELRLGSVLTIEAENMAEATAMLEAARLDASQRRFSLRIGRATSKLFVGLFVAPLVLLGGTAALGFGLMSVLSALLSARTIFLGALGVTALAIAVFWRAYMSTRLTIGSDGIVVRRGFRRRFIPYGRLADITQKGSDIALQYRDGKIEPIPGDIDDPARRSALVQRMRDAMSSGAATHTRVEALGRNGRPITAWRDALLGLLQSDAGYRRIGLSREDALGIVKDAGARTEHRIAAAVALSAAKDPELKERIRIAARACASERVRIALEQAGDGELEEAVVEQALLEEQQAR